MRKNFCFNANANTKLCIALISTEYIDSHAQRSENVLRDLHEPCCVFSLGTVELAHDRQPTSNRRQRCAGGDSTDDSETGGIFCNCGAESCEGAGADPRR